MHLDPYRRQLLKNERQSLYDLKDDLYRQTDALTREIDRLHKVARSIEDNDLAARPRRDEAYTQINELRSRRGLLFEGIQGIKGRLELLKITLRMCG